MPGRAFLPFKNKSDMIKVLKEVGFTDNDIEEGSRVITVDSSKYFLRIDSICIVRFSKNDNEYSRLWIHNKIPSVENLKKFLKLRGEYSLIGRKIVKETQATAEKVFAYKGQVITASSKQEAIKQIVESAKKAPIPKLTKDQETKLKEMYIDFWPYYCGAVDVGKMGLSGNPKAERRSNKIYEYLESIYGYDYVYSISTNFDVSLNNLQMKLEDELWNKNVDNVNRWKNRNCRGALFQLAKMSLNDILDKIKKLDLNKTFEKIIKNNDSIDL